VRFRRRTRFDELVGRQLDLLGSDEAPLLAEIVQREDAWNQSSREEAEEAYGDLQLALDALGDRLLDLREAYTATLEDAAADEYRTTFTRAALRRFGRAAALLEEEHT
jgi:hypothetical protein